MLRNVVDTFSKLRKCFEKKEKKKLIIITFGVTLVAFLEMAVVTMMLPLMYAILDMNAVSNSEWGRKIIEDLEITDHKYFIAFVLIVMVCIYVLRAVFKIAVEKYKTMSLRICSKNLSLRLMRIVLHRPYGFHVGNRTANVQRLLTSDIDRFFAIVSSLLMLVSEIITAIALVFVLMMVDWKLTIVAFLILLGIATSVNRITSSKIKYLGEENTKSYTDMVQSVYQTIGSIKHVIVKRQQDYFLDTYKEHALKQQKINAEYLFYLTLPSMLIEGISMSAILIYMMCCVVASDNVAELLPTFATFAMATVRLLPVVNRCTTSLNTCKYNLHALDNIYQLITYEGECVSIINEQAKAEINLNIDKGITLDRVWFKFEDTDEYLFKDISMFIPAKQAVAFIGQTGAGKTTLADIILGIRQTSRGSIYVDGRNIALEPDWWARQVGYIPQTIYLSDDSIKANIAYGIKKDDIDEEQVWRCVNQAKLGEFIETLPEGIETKVGENGVRLSGGQRQRIGIARALYTNPSFVVLDEATSALDNETEKAVMEAINSLSGEKTLLIIAHRLSTIEKCDIIYKVDHGITLVENGEVKE